MLNQRTIRGFDDRALSISDTYKDISLADKYLDRLNQRLKDQLKDQVKRDQIENIVDKIPKIAHKEMPKSPSVNKEIER
jgi:hypothetical protein